MKTGRGRDTVGDALGNAYDVRRNRVRRSTEIDVSPSDPVLTDKTVYRDQSFANWIDGDEKAFESDSAEQRRSIGCNEAWRGNFIAVESQLCFGDGPCVAPPSSDDHSLRARGFQLELFRQRSRHDGQSRTGIDKELNFFDVPRRSGQMSFYVEKPHLKYLFRNQVIVAKSISNATARNEAR